VKTTLYDLYAFLSSVDEIKILVVEQFKFYIPGANMPKCKKLIEDLNVNHEIGNLWGGNLLHKII
jgi:hypothetical protein